MKKKLQLMALFILTMAIVVLAGCAGAGKGGDNALSEGGIVQLVDLEGGFYGIITHWGNKYEPINLSKEFQKAGLLVNVEAKIRTDVTTTHMWGTPIEIINITKVATG